MSDPLSNLFASTLEVEALLTLYPTRFTEKLQGIRMKSWTVSTPRQIFPPILLSAR